MEKKRLKELFFTWSSGSTFAKLGYFKLHLNIHRMIVINFSVIVIKFMNEYIYIYMLIIYIPNFYKIQINSYKQTRNWKI